MIEYIDLKIDFTNRNARVGGITLDRVTTRSYDTAIKFRIEIIGHTLDDTYDVKILSKYRKSGLNVMTTLGDSLEIVDGKIIYTPKVNLIIEADYIRNFLYLSKDGLGLDMAQFNYQVDVSQIGEITLDIRQAYDESYETLITEFEQALEEYKLTLPQADSVRAEIDVILNQFGVDSQKVIGDLGEVSATIEIAEASRVEKESDRIQAETERKEAETLREENYEQLIDTAIVEADVVEKVDNKVTELTPRMNELTAQLAQTKTEPFSRLSSETNNVVSFYFDDGSTNDYSIVLPIAQKHDIPISIAALPRQNGGQYLTHAQLVELQNVHGWEIGSHTYNHVNSPTLSEEDLNHDYALSKEILKGLGLNITHLCYPFGYYDEKSMKVAKNHYDFALSSDQFSNKSPVRTYSINRIFMPNYTTAQLKAMVDDMRNEWYIFYGHSHDMDFPQSERIKLDDLISYVKSKNIPIENVTPAFEMFKNIVDVGYQYKDNKFFQVGADGEVAYADGIYKFLGVNPEITVDTPYTDFEIGKISVGVFTNVTNGFPFGVSPNGALGTVYTYRHARHNPSVYQKFELYNGTEVGYRTLSGGAWTDFVKYKPSVKVPVAADIADTTPVDYFSAGSTTIFNISQNQAPNFRGGEPGTLTVSTLGSLALRHQKWHKYNSREQYIRYWISGSNSWGAWLSLGEKKHTITTAMGTIAPNANLTFLLDVPEVKFASSFVTNFTSNLPTGVTFDFSVSAENVIRLRMSNLTAQSVDLGTRAVHILVF